MIEPPSVQLVRRLHDAVDYLNGRLLDGRAPAVMVVLAARSEIPGGRGTIEGLSRFPMASYIPALWRDETTGELVGELGIDPGFLAERGPLDQLAAVTHELVHGVHGVDHGPAWVKAMRGVGLHPVAHPGGWDQRIVPGGRFDRVARRLVASGWSIGWRLVGQEVDGVRRASMAAQA